MVAENVAPGMTDAGALMLITWASFCAEALRANPRSQIALSSQFAGAQQLPLQADLAGACEGLDQDEMGIERSTTFFMLPTTFEKGRCRLWSS